MDDLQFGTRDKRGNWAPSKTLEIAPFWTGKFSKLGSFALSYLWPWNIFYMVMALAYWFFLIEPNLALYQSISLTGFGLLFAANAGVIFASFGGVELLYYTRRKQENRFKYNAKFPSENPSDVFWFKSQNLDNFLRSFFLSIPMWTIMEVLFLYCFTNGIHALGWLEWEQHWVWLVVLTLLGPALHEVHFFTIHWLIHQPPLYKWIHSIHHNSINPSPWSSLSMHPVESFAYFVEIFWHLLIPSNPIVALFQSKMIGFGALNGHIGFDKLEITEDAAVDSHAYAHYLHHKYFEVNYGGEGLIPLDKWFGFWHDGSKEADAQMKARFKAKKDRLKAKAAAAEARG
ncbi:sterol desaturase family protein [Donghicola sp.]|jgi:sterol desaturase/sphingolipid hydroxylase (fatty acid hydroxylase superfamily)|uniref:sterol desaturase family protein n=1 Tax=Donghicola sp. TaxID=1929294 RepID=UPI0025F3C7D8|nr:sterol desaturase family protein [Donghicola sp.]MCT4579111.1 sterol desaturase family protein [Donghicola sp.]